MSAPTCLYWWAMSVDRSQGPRDPPPRSRGWGCRWNRRERTAARDLRSNRGPRSHGRAAHREPRAHHGRRRQRRRRSSAEGLLLVDGGLKERSPALLTLLSDRYSGETSARYSTRTGATSIPAPTPRCAQPARRSWRTRTRSSGSAAISSSTGRNALTRRIRRRAADQDVLHVGANRISAAAKSSTAHLPRAHTDGDVSCSFRDANVLVASDLLAVGRYPSSTTRRAAGSAGSSTRRRSCSSRPMRATRSCRPTAPVHGRAELEAQLALCTAVRERVAEAFASA